jgi:hypothetical protein
MIELGREKPEKPIRFLGKFMVAKADELEKNGTLSSKQTSKRPEFTGFVRPSRRQSKVEHSKSPNKSTKSPNKSPSGSQDKTGKNSKNAKSLSQKD